MCVRRAEHLAPLQRRGTRTPQVVRLVELVDDRLHGRRFWLNLLDCKDGSGDKRAFVRIRALSFRKAPGTRIRHGGGAATNDCALVYWIGPSSELCSRKENSRCGSRWSMFVKMNRRWLTSAN